MMIHGGPCPFKRLGLLVATAVSGCVNPLKNGGGKWCRTNFFAKCDGFPKQPVRGNSDGSQKDRQPTSVFDLDGVSKGVTSAKVRFG